MEEDLDPQPTDGAPEAQPHQSEVGVAETHKSGPHFPPFDSTTFASQLFWLAVTFILLYLMLARVALPRVAAAIEGRREKIADDLDTAEQHRRHAEEALAAYEKAIAEARAEAAKVISDAKAALKAEADMRRAAVDADLAERVAAAEARIAEAKLRAVAGVRSVAVDIAGDIAAKVLGEAPPRDALERAVDQEMGWAA